MQAEATKKDVPSESPATLVAIIRAAHLTGDRDLERVAKRQLRERFGMSVSFSRLAESPIASREGIR